MIKFDFTKPPEEAIKYLKSKGLKLTFNYDEMLHEAHHKAFTVAKITKLDLLKDIQDSLVQAQRDGIGFKQWKKGIRQTLIDKGWFGQTEVIDEKTGEVKNINVNARRLSTIFHTNMRTSYQVGRYKKMKALKIEVYWRYVAILDTRVRPDHAALHGMIRHRDDPFWNKNYPPNAWNCRCKVQAYSKKQVKKNGWKIKNPDDPLPKLYKGATKDWNYNVGEGAEYEKIFARKLKGLKSACPEENARNKNNCFKELYGIAKKETIISPKKFKKFFDYSAKGSEIRIANLPSYIVKSLETKERDVLLSNETLAKNKAHHPDIEWYEYLLIDYLLHKKPILSVRENKNNIIVTAGILYDYAIVIKTTKSKDKNYLTSFRRVDEKGIATVKKKGKIIS